MSGFTEGSGSNPSYDTAYDINWTADAKLRIGTDVSKLLGMADGKISAYGFAGESFGTMNGYYKDGYNFSGTNFGAGVEMSVTDNVFVGVEAIQRNLHSYASEGTSRALALRVGFKF
jgi:opacity protein-like surface antigen